MKAYSITLWLPEQCGKLAFHKRPSVIPKGYITLHILEDINFLGISFFLFGRAVVSGSHKLGLCQVPNPKQKQAYSGGSGLELSWVKTALDCPVLDHVAPSMAVRLSICFVKLIWRWIWAKLGAIQRSGLGAQIGCAQA